MRERNNAGDGSKLIDKFHIIANSSNCGKAVSMDGELGVASITFKIELYCAEFAACDEQKTNTTLNDCSKISNTVNYTIY